MHISAIKAKQNYREYFFDYLCFNLVVSKKPVTNVKAGKPYCIVLHCIVLHCDCIVLYCIVLYCIVSYRIVSYCIVLYSIAQGYQRFSLSKPAVGPNVALHASPAYRASTNLMSAFPAH